jgi:hypothetical protein
MAQVTSVGELALEVSRNPGLRDRMMADPEGTLTSFATPIPDTLIYRIVVSALGLTVLIALVGAIVLVSLNKQIPDVLTALGSAALGALGGLLAPSPASAS